MVNKVKNCSSTTHTRQSEGVVFPLEWSFLKTEFGSQPAGGRPYIVAWGGFK